MKHLGIFLILLGLLIPTRAQWSINMKDTSLTFKCEQCPYPAKILYVNPSNMHLGDAVEIDMVFLDYTSTPIHTIDVVQLDGSDPESYQTFIYFIISAYGWVEMTVHRMGGYIYNYVLSTIQAYEAETRRLW